MKTPPHPIFDDVERVTVSAKAAAETATSNEKVCRAWLTSSPSELSIKIAVIVETERERGCRLPIIRMLVAALVRRQKLALETRIFKHLKV